LHIGRVVTIKQVARLYDAAFMKAASVETAVFGLMTSETLGSSHWIQIFFPNLMFQPSETAERPLAEVTPRPTLVAVGNGCDDAEFPPYKNSGVSIQSAGEIAGTSGIQSNKHDAAFKISPQDILRFPQKLN
jgi:hypothetical protein